MNLGALLGKPAKGGLIVIVLLGAGFEVRASEQFDVRAPDKPKNVTAEINNGVLTSALPSVALFLLPESICTATLIGCQTALTAAHCVCDSSPCAPQPEGELFFQHSGRYPVTAVEVHPGYVPESEELGQHDLAIVRLAAPVAGVQPSPLNLAARPQPGTTVALAGFGRTPTTPGGIKRAGLAQLTICSVFNPNALCYLFQSPIGEPGEDSTACPGDSGGPMFIPPGTTLTGATSGGRGPGSENCTAPVEGVFSDTYSDRNWILSVAGGEVGQSSCGGFPNAGSSAAPVTSGAGFLDASQPEFSGSFVVPSDTNVLAVTLNGELGSSDFDLAIRSGVPPTDEQFDCGSQGPLTLEACFVPNPNPGTWHLRVNRLGGSGLFQATATAYQLNTSSCIDGPESLCLANNRFEVKATWRTSTNSGVAQREKLTNDTGYFWFFRKTNVETVVKVLNGCPVNERFWVFAGGLTNVETRIEVRDTETGVVRTYENPPNTPFQPIQDTDAFATCP